MGNDQERILNAADRRDYVRHRYRELLHQTRQRDEVQFRHTGKGYYVEMIASETGYSFDYVNRIINGKR